MGKNKANILQSLFSKNLQETEQQTWLWASCKNPKTSSFRAGDDGSMFKTVNSVFFDDGSEMDSPETPHFSNTSESTSLSTMESSEFEMAAESLETVVRQVRSDRDRIFFEPHGDSSSIVGPATVPLFPAFKESVVMAMESEDPYHDFRRSMEEMVESSGIKDWDCLEELLGWYLSMNGKNNHGFIVEAFIDLLLNLNNGGDKNDTTTTTTSFSSAASSFSDDTSDLA